MRKFLFHFLEIIICAKQAVYILYENPAFGKCFVAFFRSFPEKVRSQAQKLLAGLRQIPASALLQHQHILNAHAKAPCSEIRYHVPTI